MNNNFTSASEYIQAMGVGINSDAVKTRPARKAVLEKPEYYRAFKDRGFDHIRLRVTNDITTEQLDEKGNLVGGVQLLHEIEQAVMESLHVGLLPVVAYGGGQFEEDVTVENEDALVEWWIQCADYLRHMPNSVSFNLIIEIGNPLQQFPEVVNRVYARIIAYVRKTQPQRVIFCAPVMLSEPRKLRLLGLPPGDPFIGVEIHDYASGPVKDPTHAKYWNESDPNLAAREANRKRFRDTLDVAIAWCRLNQIPVWFGAILTAPYNKDGGDYTPEEQAVFAEFVCTACMLRYIPIAFNLDDKFIDMTTMKFLPEQQVVLNAITGVII